MFSMGDRVPIKGRHLKVINLQKKKMIMPDVILHTKNVMIPVVRPVPVKQNFYIPFSENRPQILRTQNYKNNPALLFSETSSYTLYNHLENLFEVKRDKNCWRPKNQSTKYTISGKADSASTKKSTILRNSYPSKGLSCKKKDSILHFPNTITQFESITYDKYLCKASSKSIQLSRKCNLSQIKGDRIKEEDKFAIMPKIGTSIGNMSKPQIASLPSESFYNIAYTISTSTTSVPSLKIENKRTLTNIGNREKLLSRLASNHLHHSNSEYEINVLHYESDISSGNKFPYIVSSHLNSSITNWSPTEYSSTKIQKYGKIQNDKNVDDEKSIREEDYQKWHANKVFRDIKYSWEAIDRWVPPSQRREYNNSHGIKNFKTYDRKPYDCGIKYSWQIIGTGTQTSYSLLQDLLNDTDTEDYKSAYKVCSVKYSWQIIGISTQASLHDCNDPDYWNGITLTPNKNYNENEYQIDDNGADRTKPQDHTKCPEEKSKRYIILNNQQTQTFTEKNVQADVNADYMEEILKAVTNQNLSDKLEVERVDDRHELLAKYVIKPLMPNSRSSSVISNHENIKKEELLTRLTCTLKKLNRYEQSLDKDWSTNVPHSDADDILSQKREVLPQNVEENIKSIVQSTQEYIAKLDCQLKDLDDADQQIENSMMRTLRDIDETFQSLLDDVCGEINKRRKQLILEAEIHKHESLIPLKACRKEVRAQIQNARSIVSMSENMLQHPHQYSVNGFGKIVAASNDIGRIPAVPYSEELPSISFDCPLNSHKEEIVEQLSRLGCISRTLPVQIMSIEERPAGLFVKWHITNPEYNTEEQTFIVEKADGEILDPASSEFKTVYEGSETSCFIRNVAVNQPVTIRVRIQADNVARSVHHVAQTSIPPYSWELDNKDYVITNNGKIAAKLTDALSILFSHGPQFDANHVIEFKVSQEGNDDEGIALVYNPQGNYDTLKRTASLMITSRGKIFMDGDEKLMRLPRIRFGTNIMISAFRKNAHVLRVNIESENKCVTYDWRVQTPLYFAARFIEYKKWNLMIK